MINGRLLMKSALVWLILLSLSDRAMSFRSILALKEESGVRKRAQLTFLSYAPATSDAITIMNALASMPSCFTLRHPLQLQLQCLRMSASLSCQNMPVLRHLLKFVMHHDQPITVSFLDRQQGREKLSREEITIAAREGFAPRIPPYPLV
jgi:hypothetical protein